jgi:deoxycytidylate deaminase
MDINRGLKFAKCAAKFSNFHQYKIGAVLIYQKYRLGVGFNTNYTHTTQAKYNKYRNLIGNDILHKGHAEIRAIESAKHYENIDWGKVVLYVSRYYKNDKPALARPCAACMALIRKTGIRKIVYTNDNGFGYTIENIC